MYELYFMTANLFSDQTSLAEFLLRTEERVEGFRQYKLVVGP